MFIYGKNYVTTFVGLPDYLSISRSCHTKVNNVETSRVQHVSDLRLKFALRPHHVWKYGRHPICEARKKDRKKKPQGKNIMVCPVP